MSGSVIMNPKYESNSDLIEFKLSLYKQILLAYPSWIEGNGSER